MIADGNELLRWLLEYHRYKRNMDATALSKEAIFTRALGAKAMTHQQRLREAIDKAQTARHELLDLLERLSQKQLDFRPAPDSWSAGEAACHVGLAERFVMSKIREALLAIKEAGAGSKPISFQELPMGPKQIPLRFLQFPPVLAAFSLMNLFLPRPVRSFLLANPVVKVKTSSAMEPKGSLVKTELLNFLKEVRESTLQLLEPEQDRDLSGIRWRHPLMGSHNVYETLELMANHDHRHITQIEKILQNPMFPGKS